MAVNDVIDACKSKLLSLIAPINGGVGQDASYGPLFESLKSEVDKLTSLAGGKVDWGSMISNCDELLTDRSKDFRVAIYYAAAKSQTDGPRGLLDGLVLLQELCAAYWDTMYPSLKRPRARGNLTAWYGDLAVSAIAGFQPVAKDADLVGALDLVSRTLDGELRDKLADAYGGLGALRQGIRNLVQILPKEAPPPPPPAPPPPPPK